jgi:hypothetical protein
METIAYNFHDETGLFDKIRLEAGSLLIVLIIFNLKKHYFKSIFSNLRN